jgi:periplasmic divalent cation tolerance protein
MYCVIITTCATEDDAKQLIQPLLSEKLAACIQMLPIRSHYTWKGKPAEEPEVQLLIKAKASLYDAIEDCIRRHHKYEVPEIIQVPISRGSASYLAWIDEVSR